MDMYAIVSTGGKQYKVEEGTRFKVEKLDAEIGATVKLDVVMVSDDKGIKTGDALKGVYAEAEVVFEGRGKKINIFKYKAKKNVRKRQGHRQPFTELKLTKIIAK